MNEDILEYRWEYFKKYFIHMSKDNIRRLKIMRISY